MPDGNLVYAAKSDEQIIVSNCFLINDKIYGVDFKEAIVAPMEIKMAIDLTDDILVVDKNDVLNIEEISATKMDYCVGYMDENLLVTV